MQKKFSTKSISLIYCNSKTNNYNCLQFTSNIYMQYNLILQ